ncbi:MAG: carboxymuconolactone decarboxylase family protein [Bacteroidetes bacterium]|nr:carboxymuconolactone decarboxylase family protein [Bacteroidota bacterium]
MDLTKNETVSSFFSDLGIDANHSSHNLQQLAIADSKMLRDLKLNVSSVLGSGNMNRKETSLLALSVAVNQKHDLLMKTFEALANKEGASATEIAETHACTAVMNVNNIFYRFRHYMSGVEYYQNQPAGLRMSIMMNPVLGKEFFELMSLVVSAVNGCERCVISHESSVKQHGATEARIYDAIRLAAVIKSLCVLM